MHVSIHVGHVEKWKLAIANVMYKRLINIFELFLFFQSTHKKESGTTNAKYSSRIPAISGYDLFVLILLLLVKNYMYL